MGRGLGDNEAWAIKGMVGLQPSGWAAFCTRLRLWLFIRLDEENTRVCRNSGSQDRGPDLAKQNKMPLKASTCTKTGCSLTKAPHGWACMSATLRQFSRDAAKPQHKWWGLGTMKTALRLLRLRSMATHNFLSFLGLS